MNRQQKQMVSYVMKHYRLDRLYVTEGECTMYHPHKRWVEYREYQHPKVGLVMFAWALAMAVLAKSCWLKDGMVPLERSRHLARIVDDILAATVSAGRIRGAA